MKTLKIKTQYGFVAICVISCLAILGCGYTLLFTHPIEVQARSIFREKEIGEYGTITYENFRLTTDLKGTENKGAKKWLNQTFFVEKSFSQGIETYYLLRDYLGEEVGYVSQSSVTLTGDSPEGYKKKMAKTMTIHQENPVFFSNFLGQVNEQSEDFYLKKVKIKGVYYHFNQTMYYEAYDFKGNWLGYIDAQAMVAASDGEDLASADSLKTNHTSESEPLGEKLEIVSQESRENVLTSESTEQKRPIKTLFNQFFISGQIPPVVKNNQVSPSAPSQTFILTNYKDNEEFVRLIAKDAQEIAGKYQLYPSVMIAQAILESDYGRSRLTKEANNFFGIKFSVGSDETNYEKYDIYSDEFVNGRMVSLPASFRKYATAKDSLEDNGKLLANGVSWNKNYYSGTWRSVASNFEEATKGLVGKYATDPQYAEKLNQIIRNWDLTQYD